MVFPDFGEPKYQVMVKALPAHAHSTSVNLPYELPKGGWRLHSVVAPDGILDLYLILVRVLPGAPAEPKWSQQDVDELALVIAEASGDAPGLEEDRPLALRLLAAGYRKVAPRA